MDWNYPLTNYAYRPLSVPLAALLARTPVGPTEVTLASAALSLAGGVAFARSAYLAGVLLTFVGSVTDCVDGDLARITGRTSPRGALLDSILDRWTDAALVIGLSLSDVDRYGTLGLLALSGGFLTSYARARAASLGVDRPEGIGTRDVRMLVLMLGALFDVVSWALAIVAVLGLVTSVQRTVLAYRALESPAKPPPARTTPGSPET
jgi:phosphatidylglycerophosphate synthase